MRLRLLDPAVQDLFDGYDFYERKASGLGKYFLECLFSDIDLLLNTAGIHSMFFADYHRSLSRRFPVSIYYRLNDDVVVVCAIVDNRRDPAFIRRRPN